MDETTARRILGVESTTPLVDVRRRFRSELRNAHPDLVAGPAAERRTRELIEAFRVVKDLSVRDAAVPGPSLHHVDGPTREQASPPTREPVAEPVREHFAELVADETLALRAPADEAFAALVAVGHEIGSVTYLDRDAALLEVLLTTVAGDAISMVITLQGRANGTTEAFLTLEPLDVSVRALPSVRAVAMLVANHLEERAHFGRR